MNRHRLGTLVRYSKILIMKDGNSQHVRATCIVVGTWGWDPNGYRKEFYGEVPGGPTNGVQEHVQRRGYLLLPSEQSGFLHESFSSDHIAVISDVFN